MKNSTAIALFILFFLSCSKDIPEMEDFTEDEIDGLYFPPDAGSEWKTISMDSLGWNKAALPDLLDLLEEGGTRAFMVLKDGKIVVEEYWGNDLIGLPFDKNSTWYWASAGKTLTSFLVGKAQENGLLDINESSSAYLGEGWTTLSQEQEEKIKIIHQLTMTSGLDDSGLQSDCTDPDCLKYKTDPGERWSYHNAPYTLLDGVISGASNQNFDDFFEQNLKDPIGMSGFWSYLDYNHVYFSDARSMARFGLLILNNGDWKENMIMADKSFLENSINSSQDINPSYGYLWWLNGKSKVMFPGLQVPFNRDLTPSAPDDMYAAMGKNGQLLNIVPSQNLIMIRMGDNPNNALVPVNFQSDIWDLLNIVLNQ
jgi:CubicO group peptidase (beta-lactamase class C family)